MSRPLVIAHRCGPLDAEPATAENSIAGMRASFALGADAIEIDVRRSLNGTPVLMHDRTARRTGGLPVPVRLMSEQQLARTRLSAAKEPIPTLAAMLAAVPSGATVVLDVKDGGVMRAAIEVIRDGGRLSDVWLWCRSPRSVRVAATFLPPAQLGYLHDVGNPQQVRAYLAKAKSLGVGMVSLHERATTLEAVEAAHELDLLAHGWALTQATHQQLLDSGVDGIVTDYPGVLREQIGATGG